MAYVIADPCIALCDTACVEVCPVDCIHGPIPLEQMRAVPTAERAQRFGKVQLFIDADVCICCGICEAECPVNAIFDDGALPAEWKDSIRRSDEFFGTHPELRR